MNYILLQNFCINKFKFKYELNYIKLFFFYYIRSILFRKFITIIKK